MFLLEFESSFLLEKMSKYNIFKKSPNLTKTRRKDLNTAANCCDTGVSIHQRDFTCILRILYKITDNWRFYSKDFYSFCNYAFFNLPNHAPKTIFTNCVTIVEQ